MDDLYAKQRRYAAITFWSGLALAAVSPPGMIAAIGSISSSIGALWFIGLWVLAVSQRKRMAKLNQGEPDRNGPGRDDPSRDRPDG